MAAAATPPPTANQNQGFWVSDRSSFPDVSPDELDWVSRVGDDDVEDAGVTAAGGGAVAGMGASAIGAGAGGGGVAAGATAGGGGGSGLAGSAA